MGSRGTLDTAKCEEYGFEGLAELILEPGSNVILDNGFEVAGVGHGLSSRLTVKMVFAKLGAIGIDAALEIVHHFIR
jgi:hypothetical protein